MPRRALAQRPRAAAGAQRRARETPLDRYPTAALAHALASLEQSDEPATRRLALEALSRSPPAWQLDRGAAAAVYLPIALDFSRDGRWLAAGGDLGGVRLWSHAGGPPRVLEPAHGGSVAAVELSSDSATLISLGQADGTARLWNVADGKPIATLSAASAWLVRDPQSGAERLVTATAGNPGWRLEARSLATLEPEGLEQLPSHQR